MQISSAYAYALVAQLLVEKASEWGVQVWSFEGGHCRRACLHPSRGIWRSLIQRTDPAAAMGFLRPLPGWKTSTWVLRL